MTSGVYCVGIVGESFRQDAIAQCCPGDRVYICHEPDNPHDEMALRVETGGGASIGYIGRTSWLRRAIHEEGRGVTAVIESIRSTAGGPMGVVLTVALTDDEVSVRSYFPDRLPPEAPPGGFRYWIDAA